MSVYATVLSACSLIWSIAIIAAYKRSVPRGEVPVAVTGLYVKLSFGVALGVAAISWSLRCGASSHATAVVPSVLAIIVSSAFFWLLTQRRTPVGDIEVKVGDPLLSFEAATSEGRRFHTDELAGQRTLLKFFRGSW